METREVLSQEETEKLLCRWFFVGQELDLCGLPEKVTVVGFGKKYFQRGGFDHKRAGVYIDFNTLEIVWSKSNKMEVKNPLSYARCFRERLGDPNIRKLREQICALNIRIGDLPDTPFWVGDVVHVDGDSLKNSGTVSSIDYAGYNDDGQARYMIPCVASHNAKGRFIEPANNLVLVERGNIWKLEHGEPLSFTDIKEEAAFYKSLGMSQKVLHTPNGMGSTQAEDLWHFWAGVQQLQAGNADQIIVKDKREQQVVLIKYDRTEFGNRMRAAELARLGFEAPCGVCMME